MREVILKNYNKAILVEDLDDCSIIGVKNKKGEKLQLVKLDSNQYIFCRIGEDNNIIRKVIYNNIEEALKQNFVKEACTFESKLEFLNWLTSDYDLEKGILV